MDSAEEVNLKSCSLKAVNRKTLKGYPKVVRERLFVARRALMTLRPSAGTWST